MRYERCCLRIWLNGITNLEGLCLCSPNFHKFKRSASEKSELRLLLEVPHGGNRESKIDGVN